MSVFNLVGLPGDHHLDVSQCVRCTRQCKLHMSVVSPANESLIRNDVYPNSLTFTPYLKLGRDHPISKALIFLSRSAAFFE